MILDPILKKNDTVPGCRDHLLTSETQPGWTRTISFFHVLLEANFIVLFKHSFDKNITCGDCAKISYIKKYYSVKQA